MTTILPDTTEPFVDTQLRITPRWWQFLRPLLAQTNSNTSRITETELEIDTVNVEINATNSIVQTVQSEVSQLEAGLNSQGVTVTQLQSVTTVIGNDVAAIQAQWGVAINGNGQLIGLVRLNSVDAFSTFTVVADKFRVAHPTSAGTTITAFVIGQVDGVSTVGINGNLIIDGSILARHLTVGSLSAINADIGECTAGVVRSADSKMILDFDNKQITIDT